MVIIFNYFHLFYIWLLFYCPKILYYDSSPNIPFRFTKKYLKYKKIYRNLNKKIIKMYN